MQAGVVPRGLAQRHDLGGEPGDQRVRAARGAGEQERHDQVGERELKQVDPELAGREHHRRLQRQHHRRDREQARHAAGGNLPDQRHQPGGGEPGDQPGVPAVEPGTQGQRADRQPGRLDQAPRDRSQQPQRPGELDVIRHAPSLRGPCRAGYLKPATGPFLSPLGTGQLRGRPPSHH